MNKEIIHIILIMGTILIVCTALIISITTLITAWLMWRLDFIIISIIYIGMELMVIRLSISFMFGELKY